LDLNLQRKTSTFRAFSLPFDFLNDSLHANWQIGKNFFETPWVQFGASTTGTDGLGPLFNASSCMSCHVNNGRGTPLNQSLIIKIADPVYGSQFNSRAILNVAAEGFVDIDYENFYVEQFLLKKPHYHFSKLGYGPILQNKSPRLAPPLIGMGLIDAISESDILSRVDKNDLNGDGIKGVFNGGRFGLKGEVKTLKEQIAKAFSHDIGLTSSLFPTKNCTKTQIDCLNSPHDGSFDVKDKLLTYVNDFLTYAALPAPTSRLFDGEGKKIFNRIGCQKCHVEEYKIDHVGEIFFPEEKIIRPYSDFLLHDMGKDLADDFNPLWKTPPLWGLSYQKLVNGNQYYLHDGRASTMEEAILWHAGEAKSSQKKFLDLEENEKMLLKSFLMSI
jgi:CxxC motif-containing protein (DUF1111 family)